MSITSVFTIGPFVPPCTPLCKILNTSVMSICYKQNDGTWVEKHQRFLFNVYKRFFVFLSRFYVFNVFYFFLERFLHLWLMSHNCQSIKQTPPGNTHPSMPNMAVPSDVVLETRILVSRRLPDKNESLGLGLGSWSLGLGLGLEINVLVLILVLKEKSWLTYITSCAPPKRNHNPSPTLILTSRKWEPPKSNDFFSSPCATFPSHFIGLGWAVFA